MSSHPVDIEKERRWVSEFFDTNPGSNVNTCLKAVNNARRPIIPWLVKQVHLEHQRRRLESMTTLPAKDSGPGGAQPISPAHEEEIAMAPSVVTPKVPTEEEMIKQAGRQLLAAMRAHGIESCLLTCTDSDGKPRAEWEVVYRKKGTGSAELA